MRLCIVCKVQPTSRVMCDSLECRIIRNRQKSARWRSRHLQQSRQYNAGLIQKKRLDPAYLLNERKSNAARMKALRAKHRESRAAFIGGSPQAQSGKKQAWNYWPGAWRPNERLHVDRIERP